MRFSEFVQIEEKIDHAAELIVEKGIEPNENLINEIIGTALAGYGGLMAAKHLYDLARKGVNKWRDVGGYQGLRNRRRYQPDTLDLPPEYYHDDDDRSYLSPPIAPPEQNVEEIPDVVRTRPLSSSPVQPLDLPRARPLNGSPVKSLPTASPLSSTRVKEIPTAKAATSSPVIPLQTGKSLNKNSPITLNNKSVSKNYTKAKNVVRHMLNQLQHSGNYPGMDNAINDIIARLDAMQSKALAQQDPSYRTMKGKWQVGSGRGD